jgi:hypothetical protein
MAAGTIYFAEEPRLIFIRGIHTAKAILTAYIEQTGKRRLKWSEWTIVGLADDESRGLSTALPYHPPDAEREAVGFKIPKKK